MTALPPPSQPAVDPDTGRWTDPWWRYFNSFISGVSPFAQTILDDTTASAVRTTIGLGTAAVEDYEEGGFTPGIAFGGSTTGVTFATQAGRYVKIGTLVSAQARIVLTSNGTGVGVADVSGLPFACTGVVRSASAISVAGGVDDVGPYYINVDAGATTLTIRQHVIGVGIIIATDVEITDTADIAFTAVYRTA